MRPLPADRLLLRCSLVALCCLSTCPIGAVETTVEDLPHLQMVVRMEAGSFDGYSGPLLGSLLVFGAEALRTTAQDGEDFGSLVFVGPAAEPPPGPLYIPFRGPMRLADATHDQAGRITSFILKADEPSHPLVLSFEKAGPGWRGFIVRYDHADGDRARPERPSGVAWLEEQLTPR